MSRLALRHTLSLFLITLSGSALALGLGELRGQSNLGERLRLEVDILGEIRAGIDSSCFRLIRPSGREDLPWLKNATLNVRKGIPPVLEIRSEIPLREPVFQLAVQVGCGHEVAREYLLLASPANVSTAQAPAYIESSLPSEAAAMRRPGRERLPRSEPTGEPVRLAPRLPVKRTAAARLQDRMLPVQNAEGTEPALRLATELLPRERGSEVGEAQRELLRLEFRMLLAMREQAATQLETAEKLRDMESTLGDLQQRAAEFTQRVEKGAASPDAPRPLGKDFLPVAPPLTTPPAVGAPEQGEKPWMGEWSVYGAALGIFLGLAGWFGWKKYAGSRQRQEESQFPLPVPELQIDPKREQEREELGGVDLAVEPVAMGMPMQVDFELETNHEGSPMITEQAPLTTPINSVFSTSATTLDECFEANPVMELAEIMLSFGRVKGAAQALQEYIDNNPQEALQPWIRLMDVYRMAGMQAEFEEVARNLNQNFNVEVQSWDTAQSVGRNMALELVPDDVSAPWPTGPRPESLEDLPRLMTTVCNLWATGDVVGYLYQLLRDNRGGKRIGFALAIVEEILFLVELKETSNRMEKESAAS